MFIFIEPYTGKTARGVYEAAGTPGLGRGMDI